MLYGLIIIIMSKRLKKVQLDYEQANAEAAMAAEVDVVRNIYYMLTTWPADHPCPTCDALRGAGKAL